MPETIILSPLPKTWILDLDGTLVKHNGYKMDGRDTLLPGAREFLTNIRPDDMVVILTSRTDEYRELTLDFLRENSIRYDHIIFDVPYGERIVVNDRKPSDLEMVLAISTGRDIAPEVDIVRDENR